MRTAGPSRRRRSSASLQSGGPRGANPAHPSTRGRSRSRAEALLSCGSRAGATLTTPRSAGWPWKTTDSRSSSTLESQPPPGPARSTCETRAHANTCATRSAERAPAPSPRPPSSGPPSATSLLSRRACSGRRPPIRSEKGSNRGSEARSSIARSSSHSTRFEGVRPDSRRVGSHRWSSRRSGSPPRERCSLGRRGRHFIEPKSSVLDVTAVVGGRSRKNPTSGLFKGERSFGERGARQPWR